VEMRQIRVNTLWQLDVVKIEFRTFCGRITRLILVAHQPSRIAFSDFSLLTFTFQQSTPPMRGI